MRRSSRFLLPALAFLLAACASAPQERTSASANPNVIVESELSAYADRPVAQTIQRLRPQFLRTRGASSINRTSIDVVVVYLGHTRMGGPEALGQIRTGDIKEVRYLGPADATQRYGLNHTAGAIVLTPR